MTLKTLITALFLSAFVEAHGYIKWIGIDNTLYPGWNPHSDQGAKRISYGYHHSNHPRYAPRDPLSLDVICNSKPQPPALIAPARAGSDVSFGWSTWPLTHKGPIMNYLARYEGDIANVDLSQLEFFKISEAGLLPDNKTWATDVLNSNKNITTVRIPHDIKPGKYILRHELITLHFATEDSLYMDSPAQAIGPQFFAFCFNIDVSGSGTASPPGVKFPGAYKPDDHGLYFDIYRKIAPYPIPGPRPYIPASAAPVLQPKPYNIVSPTGDLTKDLEYFADMYLQAVKYDGYNLDVNQKRQLLGPNPNMTGPPLGSVPPGSTILP